MENTWKKNTLETKDRSKYRVLVERIYEEHNKPLKGYNTQEKMLQSFFAKTSKRKNVWKRDTFRDLLIHMHEERCFSMLMSTKYVEVLHNMSAFGNRFVRDLKQWKNICFTPEAQLSTLIRFCFAKYDVPIFLEQAFFEGNKKYMLWYVQLGMGRSVRDLKGMPIKLTANMAHNFRQIPKGFSIAQGLRFVQAIGLGAERNRAFQIAATSLSRNNFRDEAFWSTVVRFFARVELFNSQEVDHIIDYIAYRYREDNSFTMKGRTMAALQAQSGEWHRRIYLEYRAKTGLSWRPSGIRPFEKKVQENGIDVTYKMIELCSSVELYREGLEMEHCVATYDQICYEGKSAIFSLQRQVLNTAPYRLATVEVCLEGKEIVQEQAKYNARPTDEAYKMIRQWEKENMFFGNEPVKKVQQSYETGHRQEVYLNANRIENGLGCWSYIIIWIILSIIKAFATLLN